MPKKSESYESMLNKLETIVNEMDSENISLEESIKKYEDGIKLYQKLYKTLSEAEGKIKILTEKSEKDFEIKNN